MYQIYRNIMDSDHNPLRELPPAQRLQAMIVLSVMWTTIFCFSTTNWFWYRELVIGHLLFVLGIVITAATFRMASQGEQKPVATYRDYPRQDSTARYDDVWGG